MKVLVQMVGIMCPFLKTLLCILVHFISAWVGWWDGIKEGNWVSVLNSTDNEGFTNWAPGEPNGGTKQNCARIMFSKKQWASAKCSQEFCAMCKLPHNKKFLIRGKQSISKFLVENENDFYISFRTL